MNCKTCRHWLRFITWEGFGSCLLIQEMKGESPITKTAQIRIYDRSTRCLRKGLTVPELVTPETFGCIHYEKKVR